jgi:hypothetical protein
MVAAPHKKHQNDVNKLVHTVHTQELNWVQNNSIFLDSIVNLKIINKILISHHRTFHLKNDSDSDKKVITWAWPASTTII